MMFKFCHLWTNTITFDLSQKGTHNNAVCTYVSLNHTKYNTTLQTHLQCPQVQYPSQTNNQECNLRSNLIGYYENATFAIPNISVDTCTSHKLCLYETILIIFVLSVLEKKDTSCHFAKEHCHHNYPMIFLQPKVWLMYDWCMLK